MEKDTSRMHTDHLFYLETSMNTNNIVELEMQSQIIVD